MRLEYIGSVLAVLATASQVSAFASPSHFLSLGASAPLMPVVSPLVQEIRADVALAGQKKKKKGKKKKKVKEPIAAPYTVAQGTRKAKEEQGTVLQTTVEPAEAPKVEEPVSQVSEAAMEVPEAEAVSAASTIKVESEAERLTREAKEQASKARQKVITRSLVGSPTSS